MSILSQTHIVMLSMIEPKYFHSESQYEHQIKAMNEELDQIEKNQTWELVPRPTNKIFIGTKWVFRKKSNENGQVEINNAILACKFYAQIEGIDFYDTFFHVAILQENKVCLSFVCNKSSKVYQMVVMSTFLKGEPEEKVYIEQTEVLQLSRSTEVLSRLKKAWYGLK